MKLKHIIFTFLFFIILIKLSFAEPGIKIVEPADGSIVHPGEEISLRVETVEGFLVTEGQVMSKIFFEQFTRLPAIFTIKIPIDASGAILIGVMAGSAPDKYTSDEINLKVEQAASLASFDFEDFGLYIFTTDWDGNPSPDDKDCVNSVDGVYSDGIIREIPKDELAFVSSDPSIVSVDSEGCIRPHKLGKTIITISSGTITGTFPVEVRLPRGIRPSETISPTVAIHIQPPTNQAGWHNSDLTITVTAQDNEGGSGIREIVYSFPYVSAESNFIQNNQAVIPFSIEGINLFRYGASDKEGNNVGQKSLEIRLDKTPPVITSAISPKPNQAGWYNSDVTVSFTATDSLSGVKSVTLPVTVSTEGAKQDIKGEAIDIADNKAATSVTLNIDKTPPQVSLELTSINLSKKEKEKEKGKEEDEGNWYEFIYSAEDSLSGLKSIQAGLIVIPISGFKQELEVDEELEIEIDEKKKEIKIEAPNPQSVLEELKDSFFNLANNQKLQLKIKQGEPKWKLKQKTQGLEIQAPSIIFKAIASDIADNTATKELEFKKEKR